MLSNVKKFILIFIIGFVLGGTVTFYTVSSLHPKNISSGIKVNNVSGAPLIVKGATYQNKETTIHTKYTGEGESDIIISNKDIPSANKWDNYHWGVGGMFSTNLTYHALVSYRYDRFMGIGDLWFKNKNGYEFGLSLGAMYLFSM